MNLISISLMACAALSLTVVTTEAIAETLKCPMSVMRAEDASVATPNESKVTKIVEFDPSQLDLTVKINGVDVVVYAWKMAKADVYRYFAGIPYSEALRQTKGPMTAGVEDALYFDGPADTKAPADMLRPFRYESGAIALTREFREKLRASGRFDGHPFYGEAQIDVMHTSLVHDIAKAMLKAGELANDDVLYVSTFLGCVREP